MLILYKEWAVRPSGAGLVKNLRAIYAEYAAEGMLLSPVQMWYVLKARGLTRRTPQDVYRSTQQALMAGMIDWDHVSRGTSLYRPAPGVLSGEPLRPDPWVNQPRRVELVLEKPSVLDSLAPVLKEFALPISMMYKPASTPFMCRFAQRLQERGAGESTAVVLFLGDYDANGLWIEADLRNRLPLYTGPGLTIERVGVNKEHGARLQRNPERLFGRRAADVKWVKTHGKPRWELESVDPRTLNQWVRDAVLEIIDKGLWPVS